MKKHIAMFISSLNKGGSERVLVNLAEYFYLQGYKITIVTQYETENEYTLSNGINRILSDIMEEEERGNRILNFCLRFRKLRRIWKQEKPDLILSFIGKNNIMALLTSRFMKIPVVISVRGEPAAEYYNKALRFMAQTVFCMADGIILQTAGSRDFFRNAVRKKAVILKNPLNPAFLKPIYDGEREKRIVAVGRIDENKNHEMIIRAFAGVADEFPEHTLTVYGEGELRQSLIHLTEELGMSDRVSLPGSVGDVPGAIEKAAVFVLASYSEGMPNTLLEAMALGIPVISTDCPCGGPRDLIIHGENGLLIQTGGRRELEDSLRRILISEEFAGSLSRNALKVRDIYNPDLINSEWRQYLESKMK